MRRNALLVLKQEIAAERRFRPCCRRWPTPISAIATWRGRRFAAFQVRSDRQVIEAAAAAWRTIPSRRPSGWRRSAPPPSKRRVPACGKTTSMPLLHRGHVLREIGTAQSLPELERLTSDDVWRSSPLWPLKRLATPSSVGNRGAKRLSSGRRERPGDTYFDTCCERYSTVFSKTKPDFSSTRTDASSEDRPAR